MNSLRLGPAKSLYDLGQKVFGAAVLACGTVTLVWHDSPQLRSVLGDMSGLILTCAVGTAECVGGIAIQFRRTLRAGAVIIGAAYLVLSLFTIPRMISVPQTYASWGNLFFPLSIAVGAAIIAARSLPAVNPYRMARIARVVLGICAASFGIEQAEFLEHTASLVPKWILPSQMFWAIATCVPFGLAAVALLTDRCAVLAARLLTLMLFLFDVFVYIPILFSNPSNHGAWVESTNTAAIAGAVWVLADFLNGLNRTDIEHAAR